MAATRLIAGPEVVRCLLRIVTVEQGTTTTIGLEGEWDLSQRDATRKAVGQVLQRHPECLVLDLSRLSFIDSTGVHGLIESHRRCDEQGIRLVIVPGPPAVQRLFEICGLTERLPFAAETVRSDMLPTSTGEPGGSSLRPLRRRRSPAQATDGAAPRAAGD